MPSIFFFKERRPKQRRRRLTRPNWEIRSPLGHYICLRKKTTTSLPQRKTPHQTFCAMAPKPPLAKEQIVKLIVGAGQASPSPPVGPALGSKGVKSIDFCKVVSPPTPGPRAPLSIPH